MRAGLLCLLAACAGDDDGTPSTTDTGTPALDCREGGPSVEIGTGEEAFEAVAPGGDLTVVHGPQGGWHLTLALRLGGISDVAKFHPTAVVVSTQQVLSGAQSDENRELDGYDPDRCTGETTNLRAFLDIGDPQEICALAGAALEVTVEVTDLDTQATVVQTLEITAQLDALDQDMCL